MSASPLSLRRIRRYGAAFFIRPESPEGRSVIAFSEMEPLKAPDRNFLSGLPRHLEKKILNGLAGIFDEGLFDQAVVLIKLVELAPCDLLDDRLRLLFVARLRAVNIHLLVHGLLLNILAA